MRTRAQVNAWKDMTAEHRRQVAAFTAEIAVAAGRQPTASTPSRASAASNAVSAASTTPVEPTEDSFITPEKRTRKRKLTLVAPRASASKKQHAEPTRSISPVAHVESASPTKTRAERMIRRTLNYNAHEDDHTKAAHIAQVPVTLIQQPTQAPTVVLTAVDASPLSVLKRVANSSKNGGTIVGRSEERQQIEAVFSQASPTRALFVIGPPGTGKSSSVASVALNHAATAVVIRVNCSTFTSPATLFEGIDEQFRGHTKTKTQRLPALDDAQALDEFLQKFVVHQSTMAGAATQTVLVLDEVDHLVRLPNAMKSKVQALLRFLVRWAHLPNSTLRFIGILNGVDMHAQIAEFLAHDPNPTSVVLFPSYSHEELVAILANHIQLANPGLDKKHTSEAIEPRAVELIARKIAARDGDARRAVSLLQQCAHACVTAAEEKSKPGPPRLAIRDVLQLTSAAISSQVTVVKQIQQLPRQPKLLLYAITRLAPSEKTTVSLDDVCEELQDLQAQRELAWIPRFRQEEMQQHLGSLDCYALVKQSAGKSKWKPRLTSTVDMETLRRAFQDDELLKELPHP